MARHARGPARLLPLCLLVFATGCLTWSFDGSSPTDDDDSPADDDDSPADDDDSPADDDDAAPPIALEADAAAMVVRVRGPRFEGVGGIVVAGAVFGRTAPLTPSAEEAIVEDVYAAVAPLRAAGGDPVDETLAQGRYPDDGYDDAGDRLFANIGASAHELPRRDLGYGYQDAFPIPIADLAPGITWTLQIPDGSEWSGFHEGPAFPAEVAPEIEGITGGRLLLGEGESIAISAPPEADATDILMILPELGATSGLGIGRLIVDGAASLEWSEIPDSAAGDEGDAELYWIRTRRRHVDVGGRDLLLTSADWYVVELERLLGGVLHVRTEPEAVDVAPDAAFEIVSSGAGWTDTNLPDVYLEGRRATQVEVLAADRLKVVVDTTGPGGWADLDLRDPNGTLLGRGRVFVGAVGGPPECDSAKVPASNNNPTTAGELAVGSVVCGVLESAGDVDYFEFEAVRGVTYRFETWAARLGAPTDTMVSVVDPDGVTLAFNDDFPGGGVDSRVDWTAGSPGTKFVRVEGYQGDGGLDREYRLGSTTLP